MKNGNEQTKNPVISTVHYCGLKKFKTYLKAVEWQRQVFNKDNTWNNDPVLNGMIISPYLTLKINGKQTPVYASRATFSTHSFAYAEVESEGDFSVTAELFLSQKRNAADVLPESCGVKASVCGDREVKAVFNKTGSYSFVFDHSVESAFTLMVRRKRAFLAPEGYVEQPIAPGEHTAEETTFTREKTVYRFRTGKHYIDYVSLPSESVLYLEDGAVLYARYRADEEYTCVLSCRGKKNVTLCGKGAIDYSAIPCGRKTAFDFFECENVTVRDFTLINSDTWTLCFTACRNVLAEDLLILGYRMFSDGIMLSDCCHGLIQNCFIRTGDDAAEVKSTSGGAMRTDDVIFRNLAVWTDKACGYGVVYECNHDTQNVRFENCSIGFALPNWSKHLGCITVNTGNNPAATDHDIFFKNLEIYCAYCSVISLCAYEGVIKDVYIENVTAKYSYHENPVLIWVKDAEKASVGKVYLKNIVINNIPLTRKTAEDLIKIDAPGDGFEQTDLTIGS